MNRFAKLVENSTIMIKNSMHYKLKFYIKILKTYYLLDGFQIPLFLIKQ